MRAELYILSGTFRQTLFRVPWEYNTFGSNIIVKPASIYSEEPGLFYIINMANNYVENS